MSQPDHIYCRGQVVTVQQDIDLGQRRNNFMMKPVVAVQQCCVCVSIRVLPQRGRLATATSRSKFVMSMLAIMFCAQPSICCQTNQHCQYIMILHLSGRHGGPREQLRPWQGEQCRAGSLFCCWAKTAKMTTEATAQKLNNPIL